MKEKIKIFEDLKVWQKSYDLSLLIYKITKVSPAMKGLV